MTIVNFSESELLELAKKRKKKDDGTKTSQDNSVEEQKENLSKEFEKISKNDEKTQKNDEKNAFFAQNTQKIANIENLDKEKQTPNLSNKDEIQSDDQVIPAKNVAVDESVEKSFDKTKLATNESATNAKSLSAESVSNKDNVLNDLKTQIDSIDTKYDIFPTKGEKANEELTLERKETISKTDEELKAQAEKLLADYAQAQTDAINNSADQKISNFDNKQKILRSQSENDKAKLQDYYNTYKRNAENDALKRGLQRSSIVINNLNAFDKELVEKLIDIDKKLGENISSINDQINALNEERQKALDEFNITYAVKVNDKMNALKEDLQEKNDEILEYNNKIAKIEAEYKVNTQKRNQQIDSDYLDQIYKYFNNQDTINANKQKEYESAVNKYLDSLSKDDALSELANNAFIRDILGTSLSYYIYKTKAR